MFYPQAGMMCTDIELHNSSTAPGAAVNLEKLATEMQK